MKSKSDITGSTAFTLFELIVVLTIISVMVAVIVPFAVRSNEGLKIREQSRDIAQTIRYAITLAQDRHRPTKFVINTKNKSYYLQQCNENGNFKLVESSFGTVRYIDNKIHIFDMDGFQLDAEKLFLVFDPEKPWPKAWLTLSTKDLTETLKIEAKNVQIEETSI